MSGWKDSSKMLRDKAVSARDIAAQRSSDWIQSSADRARNVGDQTYDIIDDYPIAALAGAVIIGLAIGAALPTTHRERKIADGAKDKLKISGDTIAEAGRAGLEAAGLTMEDARTHFKGWVERAAEAAQNTVKGKQGSVNEKEQYSDFEE